LARSMKHNSWTVVAKPIRSKTLCNCLSYIQHLVLARTQASAGGRILVVEDCKSTQFTLSRLLQSHGYTVDVADNGLEAVQALFNKTETRKVYNLCILDNLMPKKDGVRTAVQIREIFSDQILPILGISNREESCRLLTAQGANSYMLKPLDHMRLLATTQELVKMSRDEITKRSKYADNAANDVKEATNSRDWGSYPHKNRSLPSPDLRAPEASPAGPSPVPSSESRDMDQDMSSDSGAQVCCQKISEMRLQMAQQREQAQKKLSSRILAVDDNPINQQVLLKMLTVIGFKAVDVCSNGQQAVEASIAANATSKPYDIILMDLDMPIMDGCSAANCIAHLSHAWPVVPHIVALTAASATDEVVSRCKASSISRIIYKPLTFENINTGIELLLRSRPKNNVRHGQHVLAPNVMQRAPGSRDYSKTAAYLRGLFPDWFANLTRQQVLNRRFHTPRSFT
ncbi:hypothetical protein CYMTET_52559, partial [Cymbomonas tetramitiformis]